MAATFCKSKKKSKKSKGKLYQIIFWQNGPQLSSVELLYRRTVFLKSRRVERHPYWHNCMHNCMRMQFGKQLHVHAISYACNCADMGVVQLVWTSGMLSCNMTAVHKIMSDRFVKKFSGKYFHCIFLCIYKK